MSGNNYPSSKRDQSENGSIVLEAALASLFLAVLATLLIDTAGIIHAHASLNHAAHEGGRLASRIRNLPQNQSSQLHSFVENRANRVIEETNWLRLRNVEVRSSCVAIALRPNHRMPTVEVRIEANYRGLLSPFDNMPLTATHVATYLAGDACV